MRTFGLGLQLGMGNVVTRNASGGGGGGDPYWSSVVSLLHFDGINGSTSFTDERGKTITASGNAQLSTTSPKFGSASLLLDGNGDYISFPISSDFDYTGVSMTYEFWIWFDSTASGQDYIISHGSSSQFFLRGSSDGSLDLWTNATSSGGTAPAGSLPTDQWAFMQINLDRGSASALEVYVNGVLVCDRPIPTTYSGSDPLRLGASSSGSSTSSLKGRFDEVRVTKGVARPPAVPTAAFPHPV